MSTELFQSFAYLLALLFTVTPWVVWDAIKHVEAFA